MMKKKTIIILCVSLIIVAIAVGITCWVLNNPKIPEKAIPTAEIVTTTEEDFNIPEISDSSTTTTAPTKVNPGNQPEEVETYVMNSTEKPLEHPIIVSRTEYYAKTK